MPRSVCSILPVAGSGRLLSTQRLELVSQSAAQAGIAVLGHGHEERGAGAGPMDMPVCLAGLQKIEEGGNDNHALHEQSGFCAGWQRLWRYLAYLYGDQQRGIPFHGTLAALALVRYQRLRRIRDRLDSLAVLARLLRLRTGAGAGPTDYMSWFKPFQFGYNGGMPQQIPGMQQVPGGPPCHCTFRRNPIPRNPRCSGPGPIPASQAYT